MNLDLAKPVVDAVLYEGYILYPYRSSAAKNRQRWTFGGVYPRVYATATDGAEPWRMQTECLIEAPADALLEVRVRFLQPMARDVCKLREACESWPANGEPPLEPVASLTVGGTDYRSWQEAVERDVEVVECRLAELLQRGRHRDFAFAAHREVEPLADGDACAGALVRAGAALAGRIDISAETVAEGAARITVCIENHTAMDPASVASRDEASLYSFASTHTILGSQGGAFVSLTDPPPQLEAAAAACRNEGAWPVLVGEPGMRSLLLSSPIILYDYPEIAPESPGDLFDGTEIDEILSLNILAMTDEEKREMAATDPRAAALLTRTESLTGEDFMRLHGVLRQPGGVPVDLDAGSNESRGPRLAWYADGQTRLRVGDRVVLRPKANGDVMDLVLDGKRAVIEAIERDFEDRVHVAVAVDDDPGRHWGLQRMPGHRFFFSPEEIEPVAAGAGRETGA